MKLELKWLRVPHNSNNKIDKYKLFVKRQHFHALSATPLLCCSHANRLVVCCCCGASLVALKNRLKVCSKQQVFCAISVQFLNLYAVANLSTHAARAGVAR